MTNFAKRSMIEQNLIHTIPSEGPARRQATMTQNTFDDDYEPVRPSM